jgi:transposase
MLSQPNQKKTPRRRFSAEFKTEAVGLAEQVGVFGAAKQLGLHEPQLYAWRKKARFEASRSETEKELVIENALLKRQLAKQVEEITILKKAAAYFAKSLKLSTRLCRIIQANSASLLSVKFLECYVAATMPGGVDRAIPQAGSFSGRNWTAW